MSISVHRGIYVLIKIMFQLGGERRELHFASPSEL